MDTTIDTLPTAPEAGRLQAAAAAIHHAISAVIVGQEEAIRLLLAALLADGHVLLEGVPGVGKTRTARLLAAALDTGFSRVQFTPDLMPSDVLGTPVFHPQTGSFDFKKGPLFSNIVLIDEINRAPAKTQSALFEVMEERQVTVDGTTYTMDPPFLVLATQNPVEQEGTYRLPEAQLDRFLFKIVVSYPNAEEEIQLLSRAQSGGLEEGRRGPVISVAELMELRRLVQAVRVEEGLLQFIATLVRASREHPSVLLGASPRAALALLQASKALAALEGRDFLIPEDVVEASVPVLRHRMLLQPEAEMEGLTGDDIIRQLLQQTQIPR